ncbi:MAG: pyridoxine 5'-phosphate synthase [Desulfobulbaceae bacterium]|nr:MAG: pyridoxine 5'-phosphate synthase [Desulfobulbaceae bacterium]
MSATILVNHPLITHRLEFTLRLAANTMMQHLGLNDQNINLLLTTDPELAELNQTFRKKSGPTNVLSFPFQSTESFLLPDNLEELGEIAISVDTAIRESQDLKIRLQDRLYWLIAHGLLHLTGYDHERSAQEANDMSKSEQELINRVTKLRSDHMTHLAINVDHVATIRQARGITEPDPVTAAAICELAGAEGIVVHLREDRRHIQDRDVTLLKETVQTKLNLEMGAAKDIINFALNLKPDMVTLVPEKRQELTTEGGLDIVKQKKKIAKTIEKMTAKNIPVSLFVDPSPTHMKIAAEIGATFVELHTGRYADATDEIMMDHEFELINTAAEAASSYGLRVNAGHGLNYTNVQRIAAIDVVEELSIGHAIISRSVFSGLEQAVRDMAALIRPYSHLRYDGS